MLENWYYATDSEQIGPLSFGDLLDALSLIVDRSEVLVWRDGLANWQRIDEIPEVSSALLQRTSGKISRNGGFRSVFALIAVSAALVVATGIVQTINKPAKDLRERERVSNIVADSRFFDGVERASFIEAGIKSCSTKQREFAENVNVSNTQISEYCRCLMSAIADNYIVRELKRSQEEFRQANSKRLEALGEQCAAKIQRR